MPSRLKYHLPDYAIFFTLLLAIIISYVFKWSYNASPVNFMDGDAKDYYSALPSLFITHDFLNQTGNDWFLLKTAGGVVNVHSIGVSLLVLPFFIIAYGLASAMNFSLDGFSIPFQIAVGVAALFYALLGLVYLKKLFRLHHIGTITSALIILLVFFGTNLLNYTISEAAMSHVYSFALVSMFLYHSSRLVLTHSNINLLSAAALLGLIVLVRPNNGLIVFSIFLWFNNFDQCKTFFRSLFHNKLFYVASVITLLIVLSQNLVWYLQSGSVFHDTYKADGFYWSSPQILKMLFGFDNGFFIYTPLCLLFCLGLIIMYTQNKFSFFAACGFLIVLFYFFACYWAYTYFDGLGIRVLVDYYALFAFIGAKLFTYVSSNKLTYATLAGIAFLLSGMNLIYCYQVGRQILLRSGMTYHQWKYVFLKTDVHYQNCLGGFHDLSPYSKEKPEVSLSNTSDLKKPFDFSQRDFGLALIFDSLNFNSNRIQLEINCGRKELFTNSSNTAMVCVSLKDKMTKQNKSYFQFRLNETPATSCCEEQHYAYTSNMNGDFKTGDELSVYVWNPDKKPFLINEFSVNIYNYNYNIN